MRKRGLCFLAAVMLALAWSALPDTDAETVALAKVLYAQCGQQSDETMRVYASVIGNRVGRREYGDTLLQVLSDIPGASVYDERAYGYAKALCAGERSFDAAPAEVVHAVHRDEDHSAYAQLDFWRMCGDFAFYYGEYERT